MESLDKHAVVDHLVAELAARRRAATGRRAGYIALAHLIVADEQPRRLVAALLERQPAALGAARPRAAS